MSRSKSEDEVFCRSCRKPIKQKAELCPECGVRTPVSSANNKANPTKEGTVQKSTTSGSYESEPSNSWVLGLKVSLIIWGGVGILLILLSGLIGFGAGPGQILRGLVLALLMPILQIGGWALLGMSMYGDVQYVDYHTDEWPLNGTLYIAGAILLPFLTQIIGSIGIIAGTGGSFIAPLIPIIIIVMVLRHLRTRKQVLPPDAK